MSFDPTYPHQLAPLPLQVPTFSVWKWQNRAYPDGAAHDPKMFAPVSGVTHQ
ncbi:MAG: hypothetical protein WCP19_11860 [Chloroflexota bacterium]